MDVTHALAAGMGGMRTAGDLVARMQMARGMRLPEAKSYVADRLGCTVRDLSDSYAMEQIRGEKGLGRILDHSNLHPGEPNAMMAKFRIADCSACRSGRWSAFGSWRGCRRRGRRGGRIVGRPPFGARQDQRHQRRREPDGYEQHAGEHRQVQAQARGS